MVCTDKAKATRVLWCLFTWAVEEDIKNMATKMLCAAASCWEMRGGLPLSTCVRGSVDQWQVLPCVWVRDPINSPGRMFCWWPGKAAVRWGVPGGQPPPCGGLIVNPGSIPFFRVLSSWLPPSPETGSFSFGPHRSLGFCLFPVSDGILLRSNLWISIIR